MFELTSWTNSNKNNCRQYTYNTDNNKNFYERKSFHWSVIIKIEPFSISIPFAAPPAATIETFVASSCLAAFADFLASTSFDSLDMVEMVMLIEENLSVAITDDEAEPFRPNDIGTTRPLIELVALVDSKIMDRAA